MKNATIRSRLLLGPLLGLAACSGGSDDSDDTSFVVRSTNVATSASTIVRIAGPRIAFLAAEDTTSTSGSATILNGDMDTTDGVAHVVNSAANTQFRLGVAADDLAWVGSELYLAVDELRDGRDWNGDLLQLDDVLLHWSETTNMLQRVDDLVTNAALSFVALNGRLVYVAKVGGTLAGESNLRFLESTDPLVPIPIATTDTVEALEPRLLGEDEGLVFLAFDETLTVPPRTLNSDADFVDANVLGLLDGTTNSSVARSTALAILPTSPRRANSTGASDWQVGFLVSESLEANASRNSNGVGANFRPTHCSTSDIDALDQVLTVLGFAAWNANPTMDPPRNHGLAGRDRIAFANGFVATIVSEVDDDCDLNDDNDENDLVVRWMPVALDALDPFLPLNDPNEIRALFDAPGGGRGLYELSNRFVIVASETAGGDIDANSLIDANLVGWLAPTSTSNDWDFTHGSTNNNAVEASWVSAQESENRLGVAFTERIGGTSLNPGSTANPGDNDTLDSIPTFAAFGSGRLLFPSTTIGLDRDSAGIATAGGWAFYRISEIEDSRDINADGDEFDFILERTNLATLATFGMSVLVDQQRDAALFARFGTPECGAMLVNEALQGAGGTDFNDDGDESDIVLRWFAF